MSRAFVYEDSGAEAPRPTFDLPLPTDPDYDHAAARALLEGARVSDITAAEEATGCAWGEARLVKYVRTILDEARDRGDDRLEQVAERYLRQACADA